MCKVTWCDTPIEEDAHYATKYCKTHRQYKTYAANATVRPWLFYKIERIINNNLKCEGCGYDPTQYYDRDLKELSGLFDVDHINSNIKHTDEGEQPSNYQLVCKNCHTLKSYDNGDFVRHDFR